MSRPQEVNDFVTRKFPDPVCDKCIAEALGFKNKGAHPAQITGALATTSDFIREQGECSICHSQKEVIRAHRT
ncbi:hypothetical protein LCGC14_0566460 [marine sediment metagenome]|uniref:Uncharacterized protein n=1 Tax=marine sediment metagenome TaxID=412755 RepID=A0A0F9RQQ9_9ZZZZ